MKIKIEIWKDVVGFEGLYQVSSFGLVRSLDRVVGSHGEAEQRIKGALKTATKSKNGYYCVYLSKKGKAYRKYVHRLVMESFCGRCPAGKEVGHLDGRKGNNSQVNLRYMSKSCNMAFKVDHGTDTSGESCHLSKLTLPEVRRIRNILKCKILTYSEIGRAFNVTGLTIKKIDSGLTWGGII